MIPSPPSTSAPSAAINSERSSLAHMPAAERWAFDSSVADVFDDMLARSIPQLDVMRELTTALARRFVVPGTAILDLGCSRGDALAPLVAEFGSKAHYIGADVSEPMLAAARERFKPYIDNNVVEIIAHDLRDGVPAKMGTSVILSILTLMFTPINYRARVVQSARDRLLHGGAFILVEKLISEDAKLDDLLQSEYHEMKYRNGYSREAIARKALALEGVQVPITAAWNEDLLRSAGFKRVECFWRWMNFAGWIAIA